MNKKNTEKITIKFAGDSGDGIQLLGNSFADLNIKDIKKNNIYTLVEFPPEIRAPAGSLSGISSFQISISNKKIYSTEDKVDILVIFNPAALKKHINSLKEHGTLIVDIDTFNTKNLQKANFETNPLETNYIEKYNTIKIPISKITYSAVKESINSISKANKCRNFFILGLLCWLFEKNIKYISDYIENKFKKNIDLKTANQNALKAGMNYGETTESIKSKIIIRKIKTEKNIEKISGNSAFCLGAITATKLFELPLFSSIYPITPASEILHELKNNNYKNIITIQPEDELAAVNSVVGASYGGSLAFTATSGPGLDLMQETIGLGIMARLPFVIINIQRSGPSTGIPTKSEQTDLLSAIFGRHGEAKIPVLAPNSPTDCYWAIIEAFCIAISYLGPVIILSDANLANSSESWTIPSIEEIEKKLKINFKKLKEKNIKYNKKNIEQTSWLIPGKKENIRCIGGLEKDYKTNNVSHDSKNHNIMTEYRKNLLNNVTEIYSDINFLHKSNNNTLIITWGSTYGITKNIYDDIKNEYHVSLLCIRNLFPFHNKVMNILKKFNKIIVIEENLGQLALLLKSEYSIKINNINQVSGLPFNFDDLKKNIIKHINNE